MGQSGYALIFVLWTLSILTLLVGYIGYESKASLSLGNAVVRQAELQTAADRSIILVISQLYNQQSSLQFNEPIHIQDGAVDIVVNLRPTLGKLDLNRTTPEQLAEFFQAFGAANVDAIQMAQRIADFRDRDQNLRPNGAEDQTYSSKGLLQEAKDDIFESPYELRLVAGMNNVFLDQIFPYVTVYSGANRLDAQAASPKLLAKLQQDGTTLLVNTSAPLRAIKFSGIVDIHASASTATGAKIDRRATIDLRSAPWLLQSRLVWSTDFPLRPEVNDLSKP